MSYEPNIALARKLSKSLRALGLSVKHSANTSTLTVGDEETRGTVVIECMKGHDAGYDVSMWKHPLNNRHEKESRALLRALASVMRDLGLRPDVAR